MTATGASVVIPAHDEQAVIGRCLSALARDCADIDLEVVVVANGCTDGTAKLARSFVTVLPGLRVVELPTPGKIGALNAGDAAATRFPRIYLDADIELEPGALRGLVDVLSTSEAVVASPAVRFDLAGADRSVRSFFSVFEQMPYVRDDLVGLGIYALSQAGRARFDAFPNVTADDLFVQQLFAPAERLRSPGQFVVRVPRRMSDLVAVRSRGAKGKAELGALKDLPYPLEETSTASGRSLLALVRHDPQLLPAVVVYVAVTLAARRRALRVDDRWARDESTRTAEHDAGAVA